MHAAAGSQPTEGLAELVIRYQRLYLARGADIALLTCAGKQVGMTPVSRVDTNSVTGKSRTGWLSRRAFWLPAPSDLARFRIAIQTQSPFPQTDEERAALLTKHFREGVSFAWGPVSSSCK